MTLMKLSFLPVPSPAGDSSIPSALVISPYLVYLQVGVFTAEDLGTPSPVQTENDEKMHGGLSVGH